MRRAGWAVRLLPTTSAAATRRARRTLVDLAARDRRWCQGNMQHLALLRARGLRPISRLHMLIGIFSYLTSPLWLLFLLIGLLASLQARYLPLHHGTVGFDLLGAARAGRRAGPWTLRDHDDRAGGAEADRARAAAGPSDDATSLRWHRRRARQRRHRDRPLPR